MHFQKEILTDPKEASLSDDRHDHQQNGHVTLINMDKSHQLRLNAGIRLLADRKGVPVAELMDMPPEKIERDIRAARVTTWDIARQVAIAHKIQDLYARFGIPESMVISDAIAEGYLTQTEALDCYAVMPEDIEEVIRENQWVA